MYRAYAARFVQSLPEKKEVPDEFVLRKVSKLIRFFSSPGVQFVCPREIQVGKKITACLSIQLEDKFEREFGYDVDSKLTIKPKIYATLSGEGFQVKLNSNTEQPIDGRSPAWTWTVASLRNGIRALSVHLTFLIERDAEVKAYSIWLDERFIKVSENKFSAIQLWRSAKWKSAMTIGLEATMFYFFLKYVIA